MNSTSILGDSVQEGPDFESQVTCIVATYERPKSLARLIDSVRKKYPSIKIIVADNGRTHQQRVEDKNLIYIDVAGGGISRSRNAALAEVDTPYVCLLDDDFVFTHNTDLETLVDDLNENDISGARVDFVGSENYFFHGKYQIVGSNLIHTVNADGDSVSGNVDVVFNAFIAKTRVLKTIGGWDPKLDLACEHDDLFMRILLGGYKVAYNPNCGIEHHEDSIKHHGGIKAESAKDHFMKKWGLKTKIELRGDKSHQTQPSFQKLDKFHTPSEKRAVFLSVDDNYIDHARLMIDSMDKNWNNHPPIIVVHPENISEKTRGRIASLNIESSHDIQLPNELIGPIMTHLDQTKFDPRVFYARFMIWASPLFDMYDQILHLDSDLIIRGKLDHMYSGQRGMRITRDIYTGSEYRDPKLDHLLELMKSDGIAPYPRLANAGVFRVDRFFRNNFVLGYIKYFLERYKNYFRFADQSVLGLVLAKLGVPINELWSDNYQFVRMKDSPEIYGKPEDANILHFSALEYPEEKIKLMQEWS